MDQTGNMELEENVEPEGNLEVPGDFKSRPYQIELFEKAVHENSIIYLPTGTGKTYIAVLLINRLSAPLHKPFHEDGKRTVFIVNTVALVSQQTAFLIRHTGLICKGYTGDMQVDFWTDEAWEKEIVTNQILVMTAQIFLNIVTHGLLPLKKVNLLIFDECHRAVKDHPMRQIMQRFVDVPLHEQPRILGMSASLLNANIKIEKIEITLKELESTFQAKIHTVDSLDSVVAFSTNPKEFIEFYSDFVDHPIVSEIEAIIKYATSILELVRLPNKMENLASSVVFRSTTKNIKLRRILDDIMEHIREMGLYGGSKGVLLHMIQMEYLKKFSDDPQSVTILEFLITQLMKIQKHLSNVMDGYETHDLIFKFSSQKILKLIEVLKTFHKNLKENQKFCCIIFVKRRFTAKILYHVLKKLKNFDKDLEFLEPNYMIGYNNDPYKNAREQLVLSKWNKEALSKFKNEITNCIVATDVVDEGVDVPSCTLVIRYQPPMDFRAYIQSKGRARHSTSHFITLASKSEDYNSRIRIYQTTESFLRRALHGKTHLREKPTEDEIDNILYKNEIKPYVITHQNGNKSVITEQSAVSLINMYCANLIKSKFISLTPTWIKIDVEKSNLESRNYQVLLILPPVSPLKETIVGDEMRSIHLAKRSAAVKACVKLYEIGELDDHLLPRKVEDALNYADHLFPYTENEEKSEKIPGTNSKKRRHQRVHAESLYGCYPQEDQVLYLHIIQMKPNYSRPDDHRHAVFHDLLSSKNTYGILSTKRMTNIPMFPMFMNVGDLTINIDCNNQTNSLKREEITLLKRFHTLVFHNILAVIKDFMLFDLKNAENCFLVVPVNEKQEINWDVVQTYETIRHIQPPKPLLDVKYAEYNLALVTPNYRASNVYIVTQICDYLKAESLFPTHDFESYVHYFKVRHDQTILNPSQPLLEVKPISKKINCIKPRNIKAGISKRRRANLTEDFEEHLVPELCERIDFPAVYWLKATALPSILYRITQLLVAEDLRRTIAEETSLNLKLYTDNKWEPLNIIQEPDDISEECDEPQFDDTILEDDEIDKTRPSDTKIEVDILGQEKSLYSWTKEQEPPDLERCADEIQLIDIEYYYNFMSGVTIEDQNNLKSQNNIKSLYVSSKKVSVPPLKMLFQAKPRGPSPVDILQSLTPKMCHDAFNLERVETLGDSFLKFAASLYLYQAYPNFNEGSLTCIKGKLVGNLNLYYCGKQKQIPGRINVEEFSPLLNFVTPAYTVDHILQNLLIDLEICTNVLYEFKISPEERFFGILSQTTSEMIQEKLLSWPSDPERQSGLELFLGMQIVSDKTVSDCVEALIGTYLLHLGVNGALAILKWFEILPKTLNINEYLHSKVPDPRLGEGDFEEHIPWADTIEERLGYKFQNRAFLLQAFTHASYTSNRITSSYQRLEFLGDALLDFLLTAHIYETCGNLSPGELTDLRSALVNNITFACLAVRYGLHTALLAHAPKIFDVVDRFVKFQEDRNHEVNDELLWVLLEEEECIMVEHVDVPKVLGDIFESVIGAIFLDSGKSFKTVWEIIYCLMKKEIDLFSKNVPKQPIRVVHETQGANPKFSSATTVDNNTMMVTLSVMVNGKRQYFNGFGSTKKLAKCAACKLALKYLRYKQ